MPTPEAERHRTIAAEWGRVWGELRDVDIDDPTEESMERFSALRAEADALRPQYLAVVPTVRVSRCPFTQAVVEQPLDVHGLEGPFWDYDHPLRPTAAVPDTLWTSWGAVRLARTPSPAPFLCKPGPAVPYVVTDVLEDQSTRAVVSQVEIGRHTGFAVMCFARGDTSQLRRLAVWGTAGLNARHAPDRSAERHYPDEMDFDLARWIADGKLLWIAPGDDSLTLRTEVEGCPYLDLAGTHEVQRIQRGNLWVPSDL